MECQAVFHARAQAKKFQFNLALAVLRPQQSQGLAVEGEELERVEDAEEQEGQGTNEGMRNRGPIQLEKKSS